MGQYDPNQ
jgi:calpain, invertebrate